MPHNNTAKGFTLIEVLVAIGILALMGVMSWRGLDGMTRSQAQTQQRMDEVQTLQTGLAQWSADLDALMLQPQGNAIDWDGLVLRLTRRSSSADADGLLVVGWTRRVIDGTGYWLRWQSPPVTTRAALAEAWQQAGLWAQNAGEEAKKREVAITPLDQWQIFYFRNDAWSNPQSSSGTSSQPTIPEGVRLVLTLPPGRALSGTLTRDWVLPTHGGGKS
jgi:general secretion pathway protein J